MLIIIVMGLVVLTTVLIAAGLWLMQQDAGSRPPTTRPAAPGPELPPTPSPLTPPPGLRWKRPFLVSPTLTRWNAGLSITYGCGLIVTLPFVLFWLNGFANIDQSKFSLFGCIFMLPFVIIPLIIVGTQMWSLVKGIQSWQKATALEERGQLVQGVLLDRWTGLSRNSRYCVTYSFELPWGGLGGSQVRAEVNQAAHQAYRVGDPVQVRYLPENPQVCRLEVT